MKAAEHFVPTQPTAASCDMFCRVTGTQCEQLLNLSVPVRAGCWGTVPWWKGQPQQKQDRDFTDQISSTQHLKWVSREGMVTGSIKCPHQQSCDHQRPGKKSGPRSTWEGQTTIQENLKTGATAAKHRKGVKAQA